MSDRIRTRYNAVAIVTGVLERSEPELDAALDAICQELEEVGMTTVVAAYAEIITHVLAKLSQTSPHSPEELWRRFAAELVPFFTEQENSRE